MGKYGRFSALLMVVLVVLSGIWMIFNLGVPYATAESGETAVVDVSWEVVANGGTTMSSSSFVLLSTTGQPVVGEASSTSYSLMSGYWTGIVMDIEKFIGEILLPIVSRA